MFTRKDACLLHPQTVSSACIQYVQTYFCLHIYISVVCCSGYHQVSMKSGLVGLARLQAERCPSAWVYLRYPEVHHYVTTSTSVYNICTHTSQPTAREST
ncbi:hypothetical protein BDW62DRAFT_195312 [Aspergillus aurantiobrunneus]